MSAPLFPFVWQYNNQPIEVLAQEIVNIVSGSGTGPVNTANYIPVSNGLTFQDSVLNTLDIANNSVLETIFPSFGSKGFLLQPFIDRYTFGECDPTATGFAGKLVIDNNFGYAGVGIEGTNTYSIGVDTDGITIGADTTLSAGTASGSYLTLKVNGTSYKLELLNP